MSSLVRYFLMNVSYTTPQTIEENLSMKESFNRPKKKKSESSLYCYESSFGLMILIINME